MYRNLRIAVFAPGAMAIAALLAFNPFPVGGKSVGLAVAMAAEEAAPAKEAAPTAAPAKEATPAPAKEAAPAAAPAKEAAPAPAKEAAAPTQGALPDMVLGKADAPVTIVEYSSLSCPHCAHFHRDVMPALKSEYIDTGKLRYIEREFPLNNAALGGAVLARCVDPSRFFAFTDLLFSRQEDWAFKEDALQRLRIYAKQAGLTDADFEKCLEDESLQKKILAVRERGEKEGVKGTPTFFINGKIFNGAPTLEALSEAMKPLLSTQ